MFSPHFRGSLHLLVHCRLELKFANASGTPWYNSPNQNMSVHVALGSTGAVPQSLAHQHDVYNDSMVEYSTLLQYVKLGPFFWFNSPTNGTDNL
jgi:hypothetical protein